MDNRKRRSNQTAQINTKYAGDEIPLPIFRNISVCFSLLFFIFFLFCFFISFQSRGMAFVCAYETTESNAGDLFTANERTIFMEDILYMLYGYLRGTEYITVRRPEIIVCVCVCAQYTTAMLDGRTKLLEKKKNNNNNRNKGYWHFSRGNEIYLEICRQQWMRWLVAAAAAAGVVIIENVVRS